MFNHNAAKVLIILVSGKPWLRKFHIASGHLIVGVPRIVIQFLNILFHFARGGLFVACAPGITGICIYVLFFRVHIINYWFRYITSNNYTLFEKMLIFVAV